MKYVVESFVSVGKIKFGMSKEEVKKIFGKEPASEDKNWINKTNMMYDNINVILNKKGVVDEITFTEGKNEIIFDGMDLYKEKNIIKLLTTKEKPLKSAGDIIFINMGIGFLQFKYKEERAITVFAKELKKEYFKISKKYEK